MPNEQPNKQSEEKILLDHGSGGKIPIQCFLK